MVNILESFIIPAIIVIFIILKITMENGYFGAKAASKDPEAIEKTGKFLPKLMIILFIIAAIFHGLVFMELFDKFPATSTAIIIGIVLSFPIYGAVLAIVGAYCLIKLLFIKNKGE